MVEELLGEDGNVKHGPVLPLHIFLLTEREDEQEKKKQPFIIMDFISGHQRNKAVWSTKCRGRSNLITAASEVGEAPLEKWVSKYEKKGECKFPWIIRMNHRSSFLE